MTEDTQSALVIIDVQGKLAQIMDEHDQLFHNLQVLIKGAQLLHIPIVWNEQVPDKLGPTIPEIRELLPDQEPLIKSVFSCARNPEFMRVLQKLDVDKLILCGIETHVCVYQTVKDLIFKNYAVEIVADAVSSRIRLNKEIGLQRIRDLGAQLTTVEMFLFEEQKIATGDTMRQLVQLVK